MYTEYGKIMHAAHLMQIDCVLFRFKSNDSLNDAIRSAINTGQDVLPVIDNNGILRGIIRLAMPDVAVRSGKPFEERCLKSGRSMDENYIGVTPDASEGLIDKLMSCKAPRTSIIVHDNQKRFLGIIRPGAITPRLK